jgi:hypothetical protein
MSATKTPAPPPAAMTASQLLTAAADWIDSHGWIQGNYYDPDTLACCALGALHFGARNFDRGDRSARRAAFTEAENALADVAAEWNNAPIGVIEWNNHGCIDGADAVVWMQKATAKLEEHGR